MITRSPALQRGSSSGRARWRPLPGGLALAAALVVTACAPVIGPAVADAQLTVRVKTALLNDVDLGTQPIEVRVEGGVVRLTGRVRSDADRDRAIDIVRRVPGVRDVQSSLEVGLRPGTQEPGVPRPSALAEPAEPRRLVGLGVSLSTARSQASELGDASGIGMVLRLPARNGWGPTVGFSWTTLDVTSGPSGVAALARLRLRPVMAGVLYGYARGRWAASASLVGGYSFNSVVVDQREAGPGRAIAAAGSLAWRPSVTVWYDVGPRLGLEAFAGYLVTRPRVTFASDDAIVRRRLRADALILGVGLAYWVF